MTNLDSIQDAIDFLGAIQDNEIYTQLLQGPIMIKDISASLIPELDVLIEMNIAKKDSVVTICDNAIDVVNQFIETQKNIRCKNI